MNKKKVYLGVFVLILLIGLGVLLSNLTVENTGEQTAEITPGEEITEEQERQTIVSLYYTNTETNTLMPEAKVIDAKELLENPYVALVNYLIKPAKGEKLKSSIPENTSVISGSLEGDIAVVNLSKEFIEGNNQNSDAIKLSIYSVVNTLTELNEVNSVKFLIDGEENKAIEGTDIKFDKPFTRIETTA